jgi:hypothetical protein
MILVPRHDRLADMAVTRQIYQTRQPGGNLNDMAFIEVLTSECKTCVGCEAVSFMLRVWCRFAYMPQSQKGSSGI